MNASKKRNKPIKDIRRQQRRNKQKRRDFQGSI